MQPWLNPLEFDGNRVKLMPLQTSHIPALLKAASDGDLWELWYTGVPSKNTVENYVETALNQQKLGLALPFAVIDKSSGSIVGSTRFCNADAPNRRVEIGYTWYSQSVQRTGINTECKYLLLQHAFEKLNAIAVEFKTNFFNFPSIDAILRLGAKQDGILRNHRIDHNGLKRDTIVFSVLDSEWPTVKKALEFKMSKSGMSKK